MQTDSFNLESVRFGNMLNLSRPEADDDLVLLEEIFQQSRLGF